jgi:hypothetical protein
VGRDENRDQGLNKGGVMRKVLTPLAAVLTALALFAVPSAFAFTPNPDTGATDTEVTVGSEDSFFSGNKQNEPSVAIDMNPASSGQLVAAGANDNIDMERCNAGPDDDCPFTEGVGVSGVQFSLDGGRTWLQPDYTGWSARNCIGVPGDTDPPCQPQEGAIGTLPWYFENGLVSDGDPAVAFGPKRGANGTFSWSNGSRLYYANLTSNFSSNRTEQAFPGFEAIAVSRTDRARDAAAGDKTAWMPPVIVSKQNAALFSDKEQIWADNASSSRFFGNVYICNTSFRSVGGAPEPILVARSTDGGDTWNTRQVSPAANTNRGNGRQGCSVRTDNQGVVYVFWEGASQKKTNPPFFDSAQLMARSFDGGQTFEPPRVVAPVIDCGLPDPATGRFSFDGVAGARTDSFPSVDIANNAPTGTGATNLIVMTWCNGPTPSTTAPGPNEQALVQWSSTRGQTWSAPINGADGSDRPDFPAVAISPDGTDVYLTYEGFLQPWQPSAEAPPRIQQGVVRGAHATPTSVGAFATVHRGDPGDARGSSQNNLLAEFLGDYNYAAATNSYGIAVWNDVRQAADCPAIDEARQEFVEAVQAGREQPEDEEVAEIRGRNEQEPAQGEEEAAPAPNIDCLQTPDLAFGNSDIWGGQFAPLP